MREHHRTYELLMIVSPIRATDEERDDILQRLRQTVESFEGEIVSVQQDAPWGRRRLAYPIRAYAGGEASRRSFQEGFYILVHFRAPALKIIQIDRMLKLNDAIFRHLITLVEVASPRVAIDEVAPRAEEVAIE